MDMSLKIISIIYLIFLGVMIFILIKNGIVYKNQTKLDWAIRDYNIEMIRQGKYPEKSIAYYEVMDYDAAVRRPWIWSYKQMISEEILEKLKPYMNQE